MREGFGRNTYRLPKAARIVALLLALFVFTVSRIGRCSAAAMSPDNGPAPAVMNYDNGTLGNGTLGNGTYGGNSSYGGNSTYGGNGTYGGNSTYGGNGTVLQDAEGTPGATGQATDPKTEEQQQEKPKKQLAAENYALGVLLAGAIAIGMMIAVFFYYAKNNNSSQE